MRIVISTGGTGGHIFPALRTAHVLRARGHQVIFIGSLGMGEETVRLQEFEYINISAKGLNRRSIAGLFSFAVAMISALSRSYDALKRTAPDKVIGFGGYGSFAVVSCACLLKIPAMVHEQNVIPGKANQLLARFVKKIAISFSQTQKYLESSKTVFTGCPCFSDRPLESREEILAKYSLAADKKIILVLGGSQGSQKINEVFFETIYSLRDGVQAIHMTGKKDHSFYAAKYKENNLPVKAFEFISPIEEAYAVADIVIARAGAATVSELGFFALPCILVPYPLADGHQKLNAEVLVDLGLARIIEQKDLDKYALSKAIMALLDNSLDRTALNQRIKNAFKQNPALELALAVEDL